MYVPVNQPWARAGSCQAMLAPWIDLTHSGAGASLVSRIYVHILHGSGVATRSQSCRYRIWQDGYTRRGTTIPVKAKKIPAKNISVILRAKNRSQINHGMIG